MTALEAFYSGLDPEQAAIAKVAVRLAQGQETAYVKAPVLQIFFTGPTIDGLGRSNCSWFAKAEHQSKPWGIGKSFADWLIVNGLGVPK